MASGKTPFSANEALGSIHQSVFREFESNRRLLSFDEYLCLLAEQPELQTRGSAQYAADMLDHFGRTEVHAPGDGAIENRFKLFDRPVHGQAPKVVGHEQVQNQIYRSLRAFARQRLNNKLVLLHGPNGSAKSSIIHSIMGGLEQYCQEPLGAIYSFNWIFPVERYSKGGIGIQTYAPAKTDLHSYARLADEDVASRLPCDLRDHPLLLIPQDQRRELLEQLVGAERASKVWEAMPLYLAEGDLCHRCKEIFESLLASLGGDFRKLLMHVQVERIYLSRRYRKGLVTIEPQMHVDAQYHQLSYNRSLSALPASVQNLNFFALTGDLVDANRGVVEYSDLLKRPVDSFKYLLAACETGSINVGNSIAYFDMLMLGSTNEVQLDAFKEFPDFTSFKARIELIRVPYLLRVSQEQEIYEPQLRQIAAEKHVAPHVSWTVALWTVLSRLKKPNGINYPPSVSTLISNLTPLEKSRLFDNGETPAAASAEDRKILRSLMRKLREEYSNVPYYEGRMGASAREMKSILFDAAQNPEFACLSPLAVMRQMEEFVKRVSEYEFLKQDVKDGYHDAQGFIGTVRTEYLNRVDREVRESMGLYESGQWEEFLRRYVQQISLVLKKEKTKNPITGKMEDPDTALLEEFEKIVEAPEGTPALESFRQNVISQIGAWSLDNPGETVVYGKIFPDFLKKLEKHHFESQKHLLTRMHDALLIYGTDQDDPNSEGGKLVRQTIHNLVGKLGYCEQCAKEVISFLMQQRY